MSQLLKQSTAVNITVLMVDSADHVTGKTGLTLTIYASKAAGTPAAITPTVTQLDSTNCPGLYKLALTTGHTDTLGELQLHVTAAGADPTDQAHQVVLDLPGVAQTGDNYARIGAPTGASIAADIATRLATSGYTAPPSAATVAAAAAVAVVDQALSGHTTSGTVGGGINAAASAGDPWATLLPGAYGAGTAGKLVGDNINAPVGSVPTANANADALLDRAAGVETNRTLRQALRLMLASMAGKLSGAATTTITVRDTNDSKDRIVATVDSSGNRSSLTYDAS